MHQEGDAASLFPHTGLFSFSQRPGQLGEVLVWLGLALTVLPLPFGPLALASPLTVLALVTFVTGPRLTRAMNEGDIDAYRSSLAIDNAFAPSPSPTHP